MDKQTPPKDPNAQSPRKAYPPPLCPECGSLGHNPRSQCEGNDLAAPEQLANTGSDESAQATIEDKELQTQIEDWLDNASHSNKLPLKINFSDIQKIAEYLTPEIQAIITTETTKATEAALLANEKELTRRLKLLQKDFKNEQDNNNLVFTYVFDQVRQTTHKDRLNALQKEQP